MTEKCRILIVEHDQKIRQGIREVLRPCPYLIEEASDGVDGLQKVVSFRPDLIVMAVTMPRLDGLTMCKHLRLTLMTQDIPVILLSAGKKSVCTLEGLQAGAADLIMKPIDGYELLARVERQLETKEKLDRLTGEKEDLLRIQKMIHTLYEKKTIYDLLYTLVRTLAEVMQLERCSFVRIRNGHTVGVVEASSDSPRVRNLEIDLEKYPELVEVFQSRQTLLIPDIETSPIMQPVREHLKRVRYQSLVLLPVLAEGSIVGTLLLSSARSGLPFTERDVWFLETIIAAASPAILNAQRYEEMEEWLLSTTDLDDDLVDAPAECISPERDPAKEMMEEVFRIKGGIDRLKALRKNLLHKDRTDPSSSHSA
jgi:DNA-binding response OmpR family regulator